ncbi:hypothetical protein [Streptomyces sp. NPDC002133]|uniref:hypothetical protein n=1 Tax=Streptomyces sp. NPDC002133 TaxID=3154409 RepID=UPI0033242D2C
MDLSDTHVIMPMSWGSVGKVAPRVLDLASRHGLVCFDPQTEVLHVPPKLRGTDGLRLQPCAGLPVEDPDPDVVERAVHQVSGQNWFLILEKRLGRYVQVGGELRGNRWFRC